MYIGDYVKCSRDAVILKSRTFRVTDLPLFGNPGLNNLTVSVGREAVFTCIVENLGPYKVRRKLYTPRISTHGCSCTAAPCCRCNCTPRCARWCLPMQLKLILTNDTPRNFRQIAKWYYLLSFETHFSKSKPRDRWNFHHFNFIIARINLSAIVILYN